MGYVYILASKRNGTLYMGVTAHLVKRIYEHKTKIGSEFTKKYNVTHLVYYAEYGCIVEAIASEKKLKNFSRKKKIKLIEDLNPEWDDWYYWLL
jgi:putative endonuclease